MSRPLRITLVNQFYPPDLSPTAHLTASLAGHLAAGGHRVTVITGGEGYVGPRSGRSTTSPDGVHVVHLWTPALGKGSVAKRLSDYASFLAGATLRLAVLRRQDVVVSLTTPPYVVVSAMAHKVLHRRTRVVLWSMDCYPDVIERLGSRTGGGPVVHVGPPTRRAAIAARVRAVLRPVASLRRGGPMSRVLRGVNRWVFRRLDHVVALDEPMRELLLDGYGWGTGHPPATVIPNWEPRAEFPTAPDRSEDGRWPATDDDAGLAGRFVVVYLGNLGYGHRVGTPVAAAGLLPADEDVRWLFVGGGARWEELAGLAATEGAADRILQRDYVPKARTREVMAGAGAALILLGDDALGLMSPSKLHANLAAGLPILYVGPAGSNVDEAIDRFGCGVSIRSDDAEGLAAAVRRLRDDHGWRRELSANARRAFEEAYSDTATLPRWDAVLGT
ncbi:MAG TPA: glycosyltransferase family 4 protein [Iamia sp.]